MLCFSVCFVGLYKQISNIPARVPRVQFHINVLDGGRYFPTELVARVLWTSSRSKFDLQCTFSSDASLVLVSRTRSWLV